MLNESSFSRALRRVLNLRDSIVNTHGGNRDTIKWSNILLTRILFLQLLPTAVSRNLGIENWFLSETGLNLALNPTPELKRLGLFSAPLPDNGIDTGEIGKWDALANLDLKSIPGGIMPDYRILLLGSIAEVLTSRLKRKRKGAFYTPFRLSRCICDLGLNAFINQHEYQSHSDELSGLLSLRILDNACGGGTFLIAMLDILLQRILSKVDDIGSSQVEVNGVVIDQTHPQGILAHLIQNVLHGYDLDNDAINVTEALLFLSMSHISKKHPTINFRVNLNVWDSLLQEDDSSSYDIIIGNPPYLRLTKKDTEYRDSMKEKYSIKREYNIHALFVEESFRQLRPGGVLSYLVHKNLLTLDTYSELRETLLESHNLIHLSDCGPGQFRGVTAETSILVASKGPKIPSHPITLSTFKQSSLSCMPIATFSNDEYGVLVSPWNKRFLLGLTKDNVPLLQEIQSLPPLDSRVAIHRGIETGNNPRFISENPKDSGDWRPVLRGRDVSPYRIQQRMYLKYDRSKLAKPGNSALQETPKVIIQQNAKYPIAYYDRGDFLVLNSTTYLTGAEEDVLKTTCVLLNSSFISWFFRTVMTNNAVLTVNLLPNNVGRLPFPTSPDFATLSNLCDFLTRTSSDPDRNQAEFDLWYREITECAVLEAYLPRLLEGSRVTKLLHQLGESYHDLSKSQRASLFGVAREQLRKIDLPSAMTSE